MVKEHTVSFYIRFMGELYAHRRMAQVPRIGDRVVFNNVRYVVEVVEWCLDADATDFGTKVNIDMIAASTDKGDTK